MTTLKEYNVTIPVYLNVLCTRKAPTEPMKLMSARFFDYEIVDLIYKQPDKLQSYIIDQYVMLDETTNKVIESLVTFQVLITRSGHVDSVELSGEPITDICHPRMIFELKRKLEADFEEECKDQGVKHERR